jgi:hypothetical protein
MRFRSWIGRLLRADSASPPPYEPPTNAKSARAAEVAMDTFAQAMYGGRRFADLDPEDKRTAIYDLFCDAGHLARREGLIEGIEGFDDLCGDARRHYIEEQRFDWHEEVYA